MGEKKLWLKTNLASGDARPVIVQREITTRSRRKTLTV